MTAIAPQLAWPTCPEYPADAVTLLDVLAWQRTHEPERIACHRIVRTRHALGAEPLSADDLLARALPAAAKLAAAGVRPGDRVILSLADPHDFLVAFVATLAAGAAAVPLPTTGEAAPRSFAARVRAVCADCAPSAAVVEARQRFVGALGTAPAGVALLEPAELVGTPGMPTPDVTGHAASAPAFIQYTSGSTGAPKGVVVTHANLLANCRAIRDATAYTRADRMVSWLPLHHDMGLVGGLLTSLYCAAETWLMPPMTFLGRPVTWIEAISVFGATLTVAPTFAYSLCARRVPDKQLRGIDLSSLRLAYIGAEPIDPATVRAFTARYASRGLSPTALYPVYGLAEVTLAATFPAPGTPLRYDTVARRRLASDGVAEPVADGTPGAVTFVSVGHALPRHEVTIVSPDDGRIVGERRVGELVVRGDSVTAGYFGALPEQPRGELATGDLAYVADGHVYVVDRLKDLVIVAGQNYAPSDIENAVAALPGLRRGRIVAFSAAGPDGTEELHLVAEASPDAWIEPATLREAVAQVVRRELGLAAASVSIVVPGSLERTSSGKVRRRACADAHRAGRLALVDGRRTVLAYRAARWGLQLTHRVATVARGLAERLGVRSTT
jgi:acyl-CoA synthetase (AMP-forming)/AMP-acid ligase II